MDQLIVIAVATLFAVVILALFGKSISIFGLKISWRDGMTIIFERIEEKIREIKKSEENVSFPKLDELTEPWDITESLPVHKDPPLNTLKDEEFMSDRYTTNLVTSFKNNAQGGDYLYFDDGTLQETEEA